eukprot:361496-Chlamydomonas_euryale.AAC.2
MRTQKTGLAAYGSPTISSTGNEASPGLLAAAPRPCPPAASWPALAAHDLLVAAPWPCLPAAPWPASAAPGRLLCASHSLSSSPRVSSDSCVRPTSLIVSKVSLRSAEPHWHAGDVPGAWSAGLGSPSCGCSTIGCAGKGKA